MRTLAPRPVLLMLTLLLIVGAIAFFELRFNRAGPGDTQAQAVSESAEHTVEPVAETTVESDAASGEAESESAAERVARKEAELTWAKEIIAPTGFINTEVISLG